MDGGPPDAGADEVLEVGPSRRLALLDRAPRHLLPVLLAAALIVGGAVTLVHHHGASHHAARRTSSVPAAPVPSPAPVAVSVADELRAAVRSTCAECAVSDGQEVGRSLGRLVPGAGHVAALEIREPATDRFPVGAVARADSSAGYSVLVVATVSAPIAARARALASVHLGGTVSVFVRSATRQRGPWTVLVIATRGTATGAGLTRIACAMRLPSTAAGAAPAC